MGRVIGNVLVATHVVTGANDQVPAGWTLVSEAAPTHSSMTTQLERDMLRYERDARRLYALVDAATAVYKSVEDTDLRSALGKALQAYDLPALARSVAHYNVEAERRRADEEAHAASLRLFDELPDAPPRMQCHAQVARDMGRWTNFGRCQKPATRIVMDREARRERVLCTIHAKEWADKVKVDEGWWYDGRAWLAKPGDKWGRGNEVETSPHWYRAQGWCMEKQDGKFCKVRVDKGTGRHEGKDHRFAL
jgi:hypothetical protein